MTGSAGGWEARRRREYLYGLWPALIVLAGVTLAPAVYLVVTSLTPLNLTNPQSEWNFRDPLGNYALLVEDARFHNSLLVQAKLSIFTVSFQLLVGLAVAILLNARSRFLEAVRTMFLIPMVLPPIVVAIIWKVLYTPDISPFHMFLNSIGRPMGAMITSPDYAIWSIVIPDVWEWFPFTMLLLLAALQMLPEEPLEAALIDGAGPWQKFVYVVLPLLRPAILVAGLFRLIDSIKAFPLIYILTEGGPGKVTEITNWYAFVQAFNFNYLGFASAITVVMVVATFLLSWGIIRVVGTEVDVE
ncbi:MAG: sugar ABC transporter permease [Chloroflexi bacterium]|nr:sugar ABC transporter permease [Chloroflexota bacterium]MCL5109169.1 sugar ABC transporter permease [Chloroflexota bacterium]